MKIIAWTGGSAPKKFSQCCQDELILRSFLFKEQMNTMKRYWGDYLGLNKSKWESARIFYNRAKHDAHATIRENGNEK